MFDPQHLLGALLNTGTASSSSNFLTRNLGNLGIPGGAAGAAGLALLGGVAVGAFEHFSQRQQAARPGATGITSESSSGTAMPFPTSIGAATSSATPPPPPLPGRLSTPPMPPPLPPAAPPTPHSVHATPPAAATNPDTTAADQQAILLIRAMISAAKADGVIDDDERQRVLQRLTDASDEERAFVLAEMEKPLDLDTLLTEVQTGDMEATQVYTASLLAIDLDTTAEVKYLKRLARGLGMATTTVNDIHRQIGAVQIFA